MDMKEKYNRKQRKYRIAGLAMVFCPGLIVGGLTTEIQDLCSRVAEADAEEVVQASPQEPAGIESSMECAFENDVCVEGTISSLIVEPQPETAYCSTENSRKAKPKPDMAKFAVLKDAIYNAARTNPALLDDLLKQAQQYDIPKRLQLPEASADQGYAGAGDKLGGDKLGIQKRTGQDVVQLEIKEPEVFGPVQTQNRSSNQDSRQGPDDMYDLAPLIRLGSR